MFTGQVAVISNKATWLSDVYELVDDSDGTTTDLSSPGLVVNVIVTITGLPDGCCDYGFASQARQVLATASISNGKVTIPGPGFQWQFEASDLAGLCAGTYGLGAKVTVNGFVNDLIIGTIAVVEGN